MIDFFEKLAITFGLFAVVFILAIPAAKLFGSEIFAMYAVVGLIALLFCCVTSIVFAMWAHKQ